MPTQKKFHINKSRKGISLLLGMAVLGGLIFITSAVADLIIKVGSSSQSIGDSEIAYYAAETAIERALFEFERNNANIATLINAGVPIPGNSSAVYTTDARTDNFAPTSDARLSVTTPGNPINTSNPLTITLAAGQKIFIDLAINGGAYPNTVQLTLPNGVASNFIVFSNNTLNEVNYTGSGVNTFPLSAFGYANNTKLIIENPLSNILTYDYELKPLANDQLPIGLIIEGIGRYQDSERRIEVARPNWVIY